MASQATEQKLQLSFACNGLSKIDHPQKSRARIIVKSKESEEIRDLGFLETSPYSTSLTFSDFIETEFIFERERELVVSVHILSENSIPSDATLYGQATVNLNHIIASRVPQHLSELTSSQGEKVKGNVTISWRTFDMSLRRVGVRIRGANLDKKDLLGLSDPYIIIHQRLDNGLWDLIYRSEVIENNLHPNWEPFCINEPLFINFDAQTLLKIECYDWNKIKVHELIGVTECTWNQLASPITLTLINPTKRQKSATYTHSGFLHCEPLQVVPRFSFIDYILDGFEIAQIFSIDFTGSNGKVTDPTSLHHISEGRMNGYEFAISSIGNVVAAFDTDKKFPVFGFGGIPFGNMVSHHFALAGTFSRTEVSGINGVLNVYRDAVRKVPFASPTNFAPSIDHCIKLARDSIKKEERKYFILLILTDGAITDQRETVDRIVDASSLPISIIITGVGQADFSSIEALDRNKSMLRSSNGEIAKRHIVKFVSLQNIPEGNSLALTSTTLSHIPEQFIAYTKIARVRQPAPFVIQSE